METKITFDKLILIEKERKKHIDKTDILLSDIAVLEGKTLTEIKNLPLKETKNIISKYNKFYVDIKTEKVRNKIIINNKEYEIQNCEDLSFGQFIDLQEILKSKQIGDYEKIPMVLSILLNDESDYNKYKNKFKLLTEQIKKCDFKEVIECFSFFLLKEKHKYENSPQFLTEKMNLLKKKNLIGINLLQIQIKSMKVSSQNIMDGIKSYLIYPITILLKWMLLRI